MRALRYPYETMEDERIQAPAGSFPTTHPSALLGLHSADPQIRAQSLTRLAQLYWRPVYKHVRRRWHKAPDEAQELTQEFFLQAIDTETFQAYSAEKAHFRTFVRVVLDRFVIDRARRAFRKKRGRGTFTQPLDTETLEGELRSDDDGVSNPETLFEREWVRSLVAIAVEALRVSCREKDKDEHFRVFERWYAGGRDESYASIGAALGLSAVTVMNRLNYARHEFRAAVLESLREFTSSERELREEARAVLGVEL